MGCETNIGHEHGNYCSTCSTCHDCVEEDRERDNKKIQKLSRVIEDIKADLLMRADIDSEGLEVVNLSDHIWRSIKAVTEDA